MPVDWTAIIAAVDARSVHVAPLPFNATLEQLSAFFATFGGVQQVRMQRWPAVEAPAGGAKTKTVKLFKGTAIVEMATQEEADALLAGPAVYADATLRCMPKPEYQKRYAEVSRGCGCGRSLVPKRGEDGQRPWRAQPDARVRRPRTRTASRPRCRPRSCAP